MTKESALKWAKEIQALAEGKTIQVRSGETSSGKTWSDLADPVFAYGCEYRIKPEPKLRPWSNSEAIAHIGCLYRGNCWSRQEVGTIGHVDHNNVSIFGITPRFTLEDLLDGKYSADHGKTWLPCGVEE